MVKWELNPQSLTNVINKIIWVAKKPVLTNLWHYKTQSLQFSRSLNMGYTISGEIFRPIESGTSETKAVEKTLREEMLRAVKQSCAIQFQGDSVSKCSYFH